MSLWPNITNAPPSIFAGLMRPKRQPWDETLPDGRPAISAMDNGGPQPQPEAPSRFLKPLRPGVSPPQPSLAKTFPMPADESYASWTAPKPTPTPPVVSSEMPLVDVGQPPLTYTDKHGHPAKIPGASGADQDIAYNQALRNYEPQKESGWKRFLPVILAAARGAQTGDLAGVAGGAVAGLGVSLADPKFADKLWKQRALADSNQDIAAQQANAEFGWKQAMAQAQWEKMQTETAKATADIAKTKAETTKLNREPRRTVHSVDRKPDGTLVNIFNDGTSSPVLDKDGSPVKRDNPNARYDWIHDAQGVAHLTENGRDTGIVDYGRNLVQTPAGLVAPNVKYQADRQAETEGRKLEREGAQAQSEADLYYERAQQADADAAEAQKTIKQMEQDFTTTPRLIRVNKATGEVLQKGEGAEEVETRENPDLAAMRQAIDEKRREYNELRREARDNRSKGDAARAKKSGSRQATKLTLEGAIEAFKARANRDPTPEEITNIKRYYGLQ